MTLAEHLADGLIRYYSSTHYAEFREQNLTLWRSCYGENVELIVRKLIQGKVCLPT